MFLNTLKNEKLKKQKHLRAGFLMPTLQRLHCFNLGRSSTYRLPWL